MTTITSRESKPLRLARYLKNFVGLRSSTVYDMNQYESVQWFGDMPQEPECRSPAWNDEFEPGDPWLVVHKQQLPKPPLPPELILPWVDQEALKRAASEMPRLRSTRLEPDADAVVGDGEDAPLTERRIEDYPEVTSTYERFRPTWEAWAEEYQRRSRIQSVYAELFRLHTQLQKQGEIVELVLGLGLLAWQSASNGKSAPIFRHTVTARVNLQFDPATGIIRLTGAADGVQLRIEDDMLDAEQRPDRTHYASVGELLSALGDNVWERPSLSTALKVWASALHADSVWSPDLKPATGGSDTPMVTFAPALILRKRTQAGMLRIYDALIDRLSQNKEEAPPGWLGLIDDADDHDVPRSSAVVADAMRPPAVDPQEVYFPLPANREQRRIVEAISQRRGVLVQGPPGTGKSHTIANLVCHLLATGKRVLITAETGRALKVLKNKLPEEIQPLCVSLLGQGGDAFAELNAAVQAITTRFDAWSPGAYDDRIADLSRELDTARRDLAKIDTELRSLREEETYPHSLIGGAYAGTASAIAQRVASERERFGWLQVPRGAADNAPVTNAQLAAWLRLRRSYDDDTVKNLSLRIVGTDKLPVPTDFGLAVAEERAAKQAVDQRAALRAHPAYQPIGVLTTAERGKLRDSLRKIDEQRKRLLRLSYKWLPNALASALQGRQAHWEALLDESWKLVCLAEQFVDGVGASSVSIPEDRNLITVRVDAATAIEHLKAGGKWRTLGFLTPKALKGRTYLCDQVTVDGQPADTLERLYRVCHHLDLAFAFRDLEAAWSDHGGLPPGTQPRIRLAAIKEYLQNLANALDFSKDCRNLGRQLSAVEPTIPEPDWLNGQNQVWLDLIAAADIEEQYLLAAQATTACLRDLKGVRELHDAHPVVASLTQAVEHRAIADYSQAYDQVQQIEQTRRDEQARHRVEAALAATVPGLAECVAASIADTAWDERFNEWETAWRWAIADNWLRNRADADYRQRLWQRRRDTDVAIRQLLGESAALQAWSHFFNRLSHPEAAALKSWREAVRAMGKATGRSARIERLRCEARQYMNQCRDAIPVWIMPRYLVAEMIDPAPGRYDLVIVDEASQLGIESLFLFYIAKKMVVVGDDQQISGTDP